MLSAPQQKEYGEAGLTSRTFPHLKSSRLCSFGREASFCTCFYGVIIENGFKSEHRRFREHIFRKKKSATKSDTSGCSNQMMDILEGTELFSDVTADSRPLSASRVTR